MAAAADIRAATGNTAVDAFVSDMSAQAGVRGLSAQVLGAYPRLDVLVNNVGGFWAHRHVTADGLERTFALNYLAPFLLTNLLPGRLTASAPARVVTVSSGAQASGRINFEDLQGERDYSGQRAYSQSKLANVMFTYELARRLDGTGVTATVLHPGVVRTSFGAEDQAAYFLGRYCRCCEPGYFNRPRELVTSTIGAWWSASYAMSRPSGPPLRTRSPKWRPRTRRTIQHYR